MSNTHKIHDFTLLQIIAAGSILMGLTMLGLGGVGHLLGNLTGQGSVTSVTAEETAGVIAPAMIAAAPHAAAPVLEGTSTAAGITIILGMILILSGLMLHALLLLRMGTERSVPVHVKERRRETVERGARMQRAIEVFWVEQEIRL
ncbi:hypothetical protein A3C37_03315 [Candidatus Peribacteria bacterium RIFCSPHIGHO2_02_FULL_53_20]|nr:MAG: hypothetical protein A3C37_03315 [Candidatus Peribacteria bacterium RIFCSPHIGHO2_02_FULL_53_20]OGJ67399.1 MAG: hypothetical protein A3B61_00510 [Candidatus Peribacteria bacterium RIFCSPLOWO2_01_FULL_53_10]OGJ72623.1 MAG: hypothetical protein A3G69_01750 [Candidatus Peribacteria bacterium RIFCSPLOWO2_12_FULL_53_10]